MSALAGRAAFAAANPGNPNLAPQAPTSSVSTTAAAMAAAAVSTTASARYTQTKGQNWSGWRDEGCQDDPQCRGQGEIDVGKGGGCPLAWERHKHCVEPWRVLAACPQIGTVTGTPTTSDNSWDNGVRVSCTYSSITDPWDNNKLNQYFDQTVINKIQKDVCNSISSVTELQGKESECSQAMSQNDYDAKMIQLCEQQNDWTTLPVCMQKVRSVIQTGGGPSASKALTMVNKYCRGGDGTNATATGAGTHRTNPICGCLNAHDLGFAGPNSCFKTENQTLPGCKEIITKTSKIVNVEQNESILQAIQAYINDTGSIVSDCVQARQECVPGSPCVLPYSSRATNISTTFEICSIINNVGIAQDSPAKLTCAQGTSGSASSRIPSASSPEASGGTTTDTSGEVDKKTEDDGGKTPYFIAGAVSLCIISVLILIFVLFIV